MERLTITFFLFGFFSAMQNTRLQQHLIKLENIFIYHRVSSSPSPINLLTYNMNEFCIAITCSAVTLQLLQEQIDLWLPSWAFNYPSSESSPTFVTAHCKRCKKVSTKIMKLCSKSAQTRTERMKPRELIRSHFLTWAKRVIFIRGTLPNFMNTLL